MSMTRQSAIPTAESLPAPLLRISPRIGFARFADLTNLLSHRLNKISETAPAQTEAVILLRLFSFYYLSSGIVFSQDRIIGGNLTDYCPACHITGADLGNISVDINLILV